MRNRVFSLGGVLLSVPPRKLKSYVLEVFLFFLTIGSCSYLSLLYKRFIAYTKKKSLQKKNLVVLYQYDYCRGNSTAI